MKFPIERIVRYTTDDGVHVKCEEVGDLVRCKDCKYREVQVDGVFRYEMCGMRDEIINLDGYCHMGRRRKDETD